jgi:hypothetical protein
MEEESRKGNTISKKERASDRTKELEKEERQRLRKKWRRGELKG